MVAELDAARFGKLNTDFAWQSGQEWEAIRDLESSEIWRVMMKLLSKVESWLVHNAQKVLLLMMMMIFPNFADAKSNSEATEYTLPYMVVRAIVGICGGYDEYSGACEGVYIREAVITDDGLPDYEIALTGHRICGDRGDDLDGDWGCRSIFVFTDGSFQRYELGDNVNNYKTVYLNIWAPVFSLEWQESNGTSSPVDFLGPEPLRHKGCRPRWKWTGSTYAKAYCPTD